MRRLSSPWTWFYKRAFPFILYGFLGTMFAFILATALGKHAVAQELIRRAHGLDVPMMDGAR